MGKALPKGWNARRLKVNAAAALGLAILVLAGCGGGSSGTVRSSGSNFPVSLLTAGNPNGEDDDPAVAVDPQGNIHVVWFSDRDGTRDLYAVHSTAFDLASGAITWSSPIQITNNNVAQFPPPTQGDQFPSLFIDASGTHYLAWHRVDASNQSHVLFATSDGTATGWAAATVVNVTTGANFDRFPSVIKVAANDLRVFFVSHTRTTPLNKDGIWVAKSADNGATWSAPTEVTSLDTATEQSSLPYVVRLPSGVFTAAFQRWKLNPSNDVLDPSNDVFYAESTDGDTWSPVQVTSDLADSQNDLAASLFLDHAGTPRMVWGTTAFGDPMGDIVQMRTADRALYPGGVTHLTSTTGVPDHSPRIIALTVAGRQIFVMIWVRIQANQHNQVVYTILSSL